MIEWLLPVSVREISPDMEMPVSVLAVLGLPLNRMPSNILRPRRAGFTVGLRNPSCISSSPSPRVSGMKSASTMRVKRDSPPKRKYAPKEERARKIGVAKATSQFVNCIREHLNQKASSRTYKVQPLRNTICRSSRLDRLDFAGVNLAHDSPCCAVCQREDEHEQYDEPSAGSRVRVNTICCVESSYYKHTA